MNLSQIFFLLLCLAVGYYTYGGQKNKGTVPEEKVSKELNVLETKSANKKVKAGSKSKSANATTHSTRSADQTTSQPKTSKKTLDSGLHENPGSASKNGKSDQEAAKKNKTQKKVEKTQDKPSNNQMNGKRIVDTTSILGRSKLAEAEESEEYSSVVANYKACTKKEGISFNEDYEDSVNSNSESWTRIGGRNANSKPKSKNAALTIKPTIFSALNSNQNLDQAKTTTNTYGVLRLLPATDSGPKKQVPKKLAPIPETEDRKAAKNRRKAEKLKAEKQAAMLLQERRLREHQKELENARIKEQIRKANKTGFNLNSSRALPVGATVDKGRLVWD